MSEGNQAAAEQTFDFTRQVSDKPPGLEHIEKDFLYMEKSEGNQAAAEQTFDFTLQVSDKPPGLEHKQKKDERADGRWMGNSADKKF